MLKFLVRFRPFLYLVLSFFMLQAANGFPSAGKASTQNSNRENKIRVPDLTFDTKGELRRRIISLYDDKNRDKEEIERLMDQRISDLETITGQNKKILEQQELIISLYSRLNETSPLSIAG